MLSFRNSLPNLKSKVRILNAALSGDYYDIYINHSLIYSHLPYGGISDYTDISPGEELVEILNCHVDNKSSLCSDKIELLPNKTYTLFLLIVNNKLLLLPIIDTLPTLKSNLANLRFVNLTKNSPVLSLSLRDGTTLFDGVEFLEASSYYSLSPKTYDLILTAKKYPSYRGVISNLTLNPYKYYTLYSLGLMNKKPQFGYLLVEDGVSH